MTATGDGSVAEQLWWHVYGGEVPDQCTGGSPAWAQVVFGYSTKDPATVAAAVPEATVGTFDGGTALVPYLTSFDHAPTGSEEHALRPQEYQGA